MFILNNVKALNNTCYKTTSEEALREEILAIWQDVFGHSDISTSDSFYELGGDSIKEIRILSQLRSTDIQISRLDWFSTIRQLAKKISTKTGRETLDGSRSLDDLTEFERACRERLFYGIIEEVA